MKAFMEMWRELFIHARCYLLIFWQGHMKEFMLKHVANGVANEYPMILSSSQANR